MTSGTKTDAPAVMPVPRCPGKAREIGVRQSLRASQTALREGARGRIAALKAMGRGAGAP